MLETQNTTTAYHVHVTRVISTTMVKRQEEVVALGKAWRHPCARWCRLASSRDEIF